MGRLVGWRSGGGYINECYTIIIHHLRVVPIVSLTIERGTASARILSRPLSLRIALTFREGSNNIEPILISSVRRGVGGVSGAEGVTDYGQSGKRKRITFADVILFNERDEELRATDRHRYNAANHFSTSGTGGRNTTSAVDDGTLITNVDRPSSL
jgi:hypothetical protein